VAEETKLLADKFTPDFLMDLCEGLTDLQAHASIEPFIGKWMRLSGPLFQATPNPQFGTAGVTLDLSTEGKRRDAFLWFTRDLDRLANVSPGEVITVEGRIRAVNSSVITLEHCGMTHPQTIALRELVERSEDLTRAAEARLARLNSTSAEPPARSAVEANRDDMPDVDFEHLKLWWAAFSGAYPQHGEDVALASARATFPKHYVRRQWVRDLRGSQLMGRPRKNRDK
jgi:hypothetical protein